MKLNYLFLVLAAFCLVFTSCGDDDDGPPPDKKTLLVGKNWKYSGEMVTYTSGSTTTTQDEYADLDPCDQDDVWRFNENGTFEWNEGATKCDPNGPQVYGSGNWQLNGDDLTLSGGSNSVVFKVTEINASTLKLRLTQSSNGTTATVDLTFTAI